MPEEMDGYYRGMNEERYSRMRRSRSKSPPPFRENIHRSSHKTRADSYRTSNVTESKNRRYDGTKYWNGEGGRRGGGDVKRDSRKRPDKEDESHKWDHIEAEFQLKQARNRAEIRIKKGRAHAIDVLIAYAHWNEMDIEAGLPDPVTLLKEVSENEKLNELQLAVSMHLKWKDPNKEFWQVSDLVRPTLFGEMRVIYGAFC
jgi:hypothetical protein